MSSNTTKAEWYAYNLQCLAPQALTDTLSVIKSTTDSADEVIGVIKGLVEIAGAFVSKSDEFLIKFLKGYMQSSLRVMKDSLSLGGGFIIIHPWNRANKRTKELLPSITINTVSQEVSQKSIARQSSIGYNTIDPIGLIRAPEDVKSTQVKTAPLVANVMSPREALTEFYNSFDNIKDPFRPTWADNIGVVGFGFLITAPDLTGLAEFTSAFSSFLDFDEFNKVNEHISKKTNSWIKEQAKIDNTDIENIKGSNGISGISGFGAGTPATYQDSHGELHPYTIPNFDSSLPELHWWGLNLSNFKILNDIVKLCEDVMKQINSALEETNNIIQEYIKAILKKIDALRALLKAAGNMVIGMMVSLNNTGVYRFVIPKGYGGVNYIKSAMQTSLSSPTPGNDASTVAGLLDSTDFSMIMFAGVSESVNLDAWAKLFSDAFDSGTQAFKDFTDSISNLTDPPYTLSPNFGDNTCKWEVPFPLKVLSTDTSLFWTYVIKDSAGKTISQFTNKGLSDPNKAKVNTSTFNILINKPNNAGVYSSGNRENYTLDLNVFNYSGIDKTSTYKFVLQDIVSFDTVPPTMKAPGTGTEKDYLGKIINAAFYGAGDLLTWLKGNLFSFTGSWGTFDLPVDNSKLGKELQHFKGLPIPASLRFATFPAMFCLDFVGAIKYRNKGSNDPWIYVTLPACIDITDGQSMEYYLLIDPNTEFTGIYYLIANAITSSQIPC